MPNSKPMTPENHRRSIWGIVAVFSVAGIFAGIAVGMAVMSWKANDAVDNIRQSYAEALKSRKESLDLCLRVAPKAAQDAAHAADRAADAANKVAEKAEDESSGANPEIPR